jgi:stage V sporulation protein B
MIRAPRSRLLRGALTLTLAAVTARILGLLYRLLLARWLGAEGLGLFQLAFPLYLTLVTWVAGGIPVAVAQLAAEGQWDTGAVARAAGWLTWLAAVPALAVLVLGAGPLARGLYHWPSLSPLLTALAPAVIAVAGSSVLRGVFIGRQDMRPPAASQVAEQAARVGALLALVTWATGIVPAARPLFAVFLIVLGEAVGWGILVLAWRRKRPTPRVRSIRGLTPRLIRLAWPITFGRLLGSAISLVEAALIPRWLIATGMAPADAVAWFGKLMGMALPLILFPTALVTSLGTSLVPAVAESLGDPTGTVRHVETAVRTTAIWSSVVTALLVTVGPSLDDLLFHTHLGPDLFVPLSLGALFLYFDIVFSGVLRGLGRTELPLKNDLIASLLELLVLGVLILRWHQGPVGVAVAVGIGFLLAAVLNYRDLARLITGRIRWAPVLGPSLIAALPVLPTCWILLRLWANPGAAALAGIMLAGSAVYVVGLRLLDGPWSRPREH